MIDSRTNDSFELVLLMNQLKRLLNSNNSGLNQANTFCAESNHLVGTKLTTNSYFVINGL